MKWWEKTVEYYFIRNFITSEMILSPLDGKEERAGDTLLSNNEKWVILEFKKDSDSLASEKKKYKNYDAAVTELSSNDEHHFLIYGEVVNSKFGLGAKTYFSRSAVTNINEIFESGKDKHEFVSYLERLIEHKSAAKESGGGSIGSYSFVAGISNGKKITSCMNLYEFGLDHGLNLEPSPTREIKMEYSGPSMGM